MCILSCSVISDSAILWTVACQAPQSMGFSRQEYWSGLPYLPPGDLPDPGIKPSFPGSSALQAEFFTNCTVREASKLPYDPAIPLLSIYTEKKHGLKGYRHLDVHCSTIYKSQDMEEPSMAIDRGMDK